ncbi:MAG: transposase [Acidimicrobiales bacterium]
MISTVDPEARHAHKTRRAYRDGYKAHVAAEPDTGLVTACDIGPGNAGDTEAAPELIADEPAGSEVLGDSAYSAGEFRAHLDDRDMTAVIKPQPLRPAIVGGFTLDDFTIDLAAGTVTCPEAITVTITPSGTARFGAHCPTCPVRSKCTAAKAGRVIVLHPHHDLLAAARAQADTDDFDTVYRQHRPMIERTIAWLVRDGHRRLRYRGTQANRLAWAHRCAAVNLKRLLALGLTHNGSWTITAPA